MKRSLLSNFDPLPHALSTKGLCALVAIVVLGTGITVERYVEGSPATPSRAAHSRGLDRPAEVRAASNEGAPAGYAQSTSGSELRSKSCRSSHISSGSTCCPRSEATSTRSEQPTSPSMFRPEDNSVGG